MRTLSDLLINGVLASRLIPENQRWRFYRLAGFDFAESAIAPGAWLSPNRPPIRVGRGAYVNRRLTVLDAEAVDIGERVFLGPEVMIASASHELGPSEQRAGPLSRGKVVIGDGCWIGARTTILPGVTIAPGVVVAAGSVVTSDLDPDAMYAGVPAERKRPLGQAT